MRDHQWRDPDLPDGVVRFPPEPRPPGASGRLVAAALALLFLAAAAWLLGR
jgi:hypothetical protein